MPAPLPDDLQHLRNLIDGVKVNQCEKVLRRIIKSAADSAPTADVIRIAETILRCGVEQSESQWSMRN